MVVFVHGLGGTGYRTWGKFPEYVYGWRGDDEVDVAAYRYPTVLKPIVRRRRSVAMSITKLTKYLEELAGDYESIVIVGHSLGSVVGQAAAKAYLENLHQWVSLTRLSGLVLFAPPRAGSRLAPRVVGLVVPAFKILSPMSEESNAIDEFYARRVQPKNLALLETGTVLLPIHVCYGMTDVAVNPFSARYGIDPRQCHPHAGGHRSTSKPETPQSEQVTWLRRVMRELAETRSTLSRDQAYSEGRAKSSAPAAAVIVTEFWGDYEAAHWEEIYAGARRSASTADVTVQDRRYADEATVDLLMSACDAAATLEDGGSELAKLAEAYARGRREPNLWVRVTPVGPLSAAAVTWLRGWLHHQPNLPGMYLEASANDVDLGIRMTKWMTSLIESDMRRSASSSARLEQAIIDPNESPEIGGVQ